MKALREKHAGELEKLDGDEEIKCLAQYNVKAGVDTMKRIPVVIEAMKRRGFKVHGVLYDMSKGVLEERPDEESDDELAKREAVYDTGARIVQATTALMS